MSLPSKRRCWMQKWSIFMQNHRLYHDNYLRFSSNILHEKKCSSEVKNFMSSFTFDYVSIVQKIHAGRQTCRNVEHEKGGHNLLIWQCNIGWYSSGFLISFSVFTRVGHTFSIDWQWEEYFQLNNVNLCQFCEWSSLTFSPDFQVQISGHLSSGDQTLSLPRAWEKRILRGTK